MKYRYLIFAIGVSLSNNCIASNCWYLLKTVLGTKTVFAANKTPEARHLLDEIHALDFMSEEKEAELALDALSQAPTPVRLSILPTVFERLRAVKHQAADENLDLPY